MLTLQTIVAWLEHQPADRIIYWHVIEPRHNLISTYYADQGKTGRSESARFVFDDQTTEGYDRDLQLFKEALLYSPYLWIPTAAQLLDFLASDWRHHDNQKLMLPSDAVFNAMQDGPHRPAELPREHKEVVTWQSKDYSCHWYFYPAGFAGETRDRRAISIRVYAPQQKDLRYLEYAVDHPQGGIHARFNCDYTASGRYEASASLEPEAVLQLDAHEGIFARWQRRGEDLVRL